MATVTRTGGAGSAADLDTYTHSAVAIGANAAGQHLRVAVATAAAAPVTINSVTIDGVAASLVGSLVPNGNLVAGLFSLPRSSLPDPAQTDVDVVVVYSIAAARAFCEMFVTVDAELAAFDFASDTDPSAGGTPTLTLERGGTPGINMAAGGVGCGIALGSNGGGVATITWSGTEVSPQAQTTVENSTVRGALISNGTAESNRAVTVGWTTVFSPLALFATFAPVGPEPPDPPAPAGSSSAGGGRRSRRYPFPNFIEDGWEWATPDARAEPAKEEPEPPAAPESPPEPVQAPRKAEAAKTPQRPVAPPEPLPEPVAGVAEQRLAVLEARVALLEAGGGERGREHDEEDEERLIMRWFLDS